MPPALAPIDRDLLAGAHGGAAAFAMRLLTRFAEAVGAGGFLDIAAAHVDGCLYLGAASLDFVERMAALGGSVRVLTTLNVGSLDLVHPERYRGPKDIAAKAERLMRAHVELGCQPTFTCAPYQTAFRPRFGEQIAWGESNAIVFANSVIGARTNRYGDFIDLCSAMTGRAAAYGLHLSENRRAALAFVIESTPPGWTAERIAVAVGLVAGKRSADRVPAILGLPAETNEDDLKALGAAAASSGAVALFHAVGLTPEAPDLATACGGGAPEETIAIRAGDLVAAAAALSSVEDGAPIGAVALGTPHFSLAEFERLAALLDGPRARVDIFVNTSRATLARLRERGLEARLAEARVKLVVDTCTYVTPIIDAGGAALMTNSGKCAYYAPANIGLAVAYGSLAECLASARAGKVVRL